MSVVSEATQILADSDQAWAALVDYESRPRWSSRMKEARLLDSGPLREGKRIRLQVGRDRFTATVVEMREPKHLAILVKGPGFRVTHRYALGPHDAGTRLTLTADYSGLVGRFAAKFVRKTVMRNIVDELAAVKAAAEAEPA